MIEETIEEAVKSVGELKINVLSKAEVNDVTELNENAPQLEQTEQSIELSNAVPISNSTVVADNSAGLGDNNSTNNNSSPPPLPENPPPSQASVFAEKALSIDDDALLPAPAHPQPCPIISTTVQSDSVSIGNTKLELISAAQSVVDEVLADAKNDVEEKAAQVVEAAASEVVEAVVEPPVVEPAVVEPPVAEPAVVEPAVVEPIAVEVEAVVEPPVVEAAVVEPVAEVPAPEADNKVVAEPENEPIPEPVAAVNDDAPIATEELPLPEEIPVPVSEATIEEPLTEPIKDDVSNDISSPLQQNSLESLPSPQSLSSETEQQDSELTPIVDDIALPPPAPVDDIAANDNAQEQKIVDVVAEVKTNGQHVEEAIPSAEEQPPTTNGGCKQNGSATLNSEKVIDWLELPNTLQTFFFSFNFRFKLQINNNLSV